MGGTCSQEDAGSFVSAFYNLALQEGMMADVGIDYAMMKYSGVNSNAELLQYSSYVLNGRPPGVTETLRTSLGGLTSVPNAVGLGALVISMILELSVGTQMSKVESTTGMLRRVFAEEKASDVRDTMHEYMKRYQMYLRNDRVLVTETVRLEQQLSNHLTRLRNSMLVDGQMNSQALKLWVNGAAFHTQMLIQYARIRNTGSPGNGFHLDSYTTTINNVIDIYLRDLRRLFEKYKTYKTSTMFFRPTASPLPVPAPGTPPITECRLIDQELHRQSSIIKHLRMSQSSKMACCDSSWTVDLFVDHMFSHYDTFARLQEYFINQAKNINVLIRQQQKFSLTL